MKVENVLEQLGYPKNEIKIYLAALDIGESTIADLARKANLPRTSVQTIITGMHKRGVMDFLIKRRRKYWQASNPDKLMANLEEQKIALKNILPELRAKRHAAENAPQIRFFNTPEEIKLIMDDIIFSKRNIQAIVSWDEWRAFFNDKFVDDFIERRVAHFLKIKLLTPRKPSSLKLKNSDQQELRQTRFLAADADVHNSNFIYGNKVALISLNQAKPVGIVIEDSEIAGTMNVLFDALWQKSSEN